MLPSLKSIGVPYVRLKLPIVVPLVVRFRDVEYPANSVPSGFFNHGPSGPVGAYTAESPVPDVQPDMSSMTIR